MTRLIFTNPAGTTPCLNTPCKGWIYIHPADSKFYGYETGRCWACGKSPDAQPIPSIFQEELENEKRAEAIRKGRQTTGKTLVGSNYDPTKTRDKETNDDE